MLRRTLAAATGALCAPLQRCCPLPGSLAARLHPGPLALPLASHSLPAARQLSTQPAAGTGMEAAMRKALLESPLGVRQCVRGQREAHRPS